MNNTTEVSLIDGTFSTGEAKEILMSLYSSKIHFHEMKIFSSRERFGFEDPHSVKRIPELLENKVILSGLLEETSKLPVKLRIRSFVQIEVIEEVPATCSQEENL